MSLCAKKKGTVFPRRGWNPPPLTPTTVTHPGEGLRLPRRTWPTSDPVSGRSGCGSGWAHQEPSKTVQLKRRTCQREVLGITRKRRATRRSRTGDLLITNSGQDETAQQYLGRLRNPDCSQIVPSRQRQSATSVIGTATNWFVIGGHPEAYVDPDDGGVGDVVCAQRSVVESPMFGTLPIVR